MTEGVCGIIKVDKEAGAPLAKRACCPRETMESLPPWRGFLTGNPAKVMVGLGGGSRVVGLHVAPATGALGGRGVRHARAALGVVPPPLDEVAAILTAILE